MRKRLHSFMALSASVIGLISSTAFAGANHVSPKPSVTRASRVDISPSLREIAKTKPAHPKFKPGVDHVEVDAPRPIPHTENPSIMKMTDGALQGATVGNAPVSAGMPSPTVGFDGINAQDNIANYFGGVAPPDTNGAVGPNHYVQTVNLGIKVWDKSGNVLIPAVPMSYLWAGFGGPCSVRNDGDPIVLYDEFADRWLVSQFTSNAPYPNHQCIAISTSGDPTGTYYRYDFLMPNIGFADYPHYGVWADGYYLATNQFNGPSGFTGGLYAFDRQKMIAGDPNASYIAFADPALGGMLPSDAEGTLPPVGTPNYFAEYDADEFVGGADSIVLFEFHADFANPANSTLNYRETIPVAAFNPNGQARAPQGGTPNASRLDTLWDRLMHRLQYRNMGSYESLVVTHTVNVGADNTAANYHGAPRVYEFHRALPGGANFTIANQVSYAPDATTRFMGSAAMDNSGNLAVGYSASSLAITTGPDVRIAGRLASDPADTLAQGETTVKVGGGFQNGGLKRWGDYSALDVDPDGCRYWYTTEYLGSTGAFFNWKTWISSFKFPGCVPTVRGTLTGIVTNAATSAPISAASVVSADGYMASTNASGSYTLQMLPGSYSMVASKYGYASSSSTPVSIVANATTTQNFALNPIGILHTGAVTIDDSLSNNNGIAEPGECIRVWVALSNDGADTAKNVVGTLSSNTTGVVVNTATANYPDIASGASQNNLTPYLITIPANFACGSTISLTINATSSTAAPLSGNVAIQTGQPSAAVNGTFTSTDVPKAIPDNDPTGVSSVLTVANFPTAISDINVKVQITHTFDADLTVELIAPNSQVIVLTSGNGGGGDNYGSACATPTVFDDQAGTAISSGTAPFVGTFRPDEALSGFTSLDPNGTWTLRVTDSAAVDTGNLNCWSIDLQGYSCASGAPAAPTISDLNTAGVCANGMISLKATAGASIASYQWYRNGTPIAGATSDTYTKSNVFTTDSGSYTVRGLNACGFSSVDSNAIAQSVCTALPIGITEDTKGTFNANKNGVFEAGETAIISPIWRNATPQARYLRGSASNFTGPAGATYTIVDNSTATSVPIASGASAQCDGCYLFSISNPATRPAAHWDATFTDTGFAANVSPVNPHTWTLHIGNSFTDAGQSNVFYPFIEALFHNGVTAGCGAGLYCPSDVTIREQMAAFVARSIVAPAGDGAIPSSGTYNSAAYNCTVGGTSAFTDVAPDSPFCKHIHYIANQGVTSGCSSSTTYCPSTQMTRRAMAVFVSRSVVNPRGDAQVPMAYSNAANGRSYDCGDQSTLTAFTDVVASDPNCKHIYYIWARGIVDGVGGNLYDPNGLVPRDTMSKFLAKAFNLGTAN